MLFYFILGKDGPDHIAAHNIHQVIPDVKILVTVRDPTDRLYSDYNHFVHKSADDFHYRVMTGIALHRRCRQTHSIRSCAYALQNRYRYAALHIGMYDVFVADWLQIFTKDQIYISKLEDFASDPVRCINDIFAFLGVPPVEQIKHRDSPRTYSIGQMLKKTRTLLDEFYLVRLATYIYV